MVSRAGKGWMLVRDARGKAMNGIDSRKVLEPAIWITEERHKRWTKVNVQDLLHQPLQSAIA